MALRMIVAWMATVAIVVFVALVVEIITASHLPTLGDVVTDHPNCSDIGASILRDGGNAVDAAVGAALCLAVAAPHRAGLGGGGVMLIHQLRSNLTTVIDFQVPNITAISSISLHSLFPLFSGGVSVQAAGAELPGQPPDSGVGEEVRVERIDRLYRYYVDI